MTENDEDTFPGFARLEIRLAHRDLKVIAASLRSLAAELAEIEKTAPGDYTAAILAYHRIRAASKKLRG